MASIHTSPVRPQPIGLNEQASHRIHPRVPFWRVVALAALPVILTTGPGVGHMLATSGQSILVRAANEAAPHTPAVACGGVAVGC